MHGAGFKRPVSRAIILGEFTNPRGVASPNCSLEWESDGFDPWGLSE